MIWGKKPKIERLDSASNLAMWQFNEDFILFIKQCYWIVWSVEEIQKVKK